MFIQLTPVPNEDGDRMKPKLFNLAQVRSIMKLDEKTTRLDYVGGFWADVEIEFSSLSMRMTKLDILR